MRMTGRKSLVRGKVLVEKHEINRAFRVIHERVFPIFPIGGPILEELAPYAPCVRVQR
jgi:hypothetical protein